MKNRYTKNHQPIVCFLALLWLVYYILQALGEWLHLTGLVQWHLPAVLSVADASLHLAAAVVLATTALSFYGQKKSLVLLGTAALIKAGAYFLRTFSVEKLPIELAMEGLCCVLLVVYAMCCLEVFRCPKLALPLELVLLTISCIGSLLAVVEQGVIINHASLWMVVLVAVLEPLGCLVMLFLNVGYHHRKE